MLFFKNKRKVLLENAQNVVRLACKVVSYRKDILPGSVVTEIETLQQELLNVCRDKASADAAIEAKMEALHQVIEKHGGDIYPVTFWSEHIEMLLVAAILAIGIRTFFFQPFKIPTNSMYPTYAGMTYEYYATPDEVPSLPERLCRKLKLFTTNKHLQAKQDGELSILMKEDTRNGAISIYNPVVPSRKFLVWPSQSRRLTFLVGDSPHTLEVPVDFHQILDIIEQAFMQDAAAPQGRAYRPLDLSEEQRIAQHLRSYEKLVAKPLNKVLNKNDTILNFDILTGDMLFVDRISYHFQRPAIGDPFVFRTDHIRGLIDRDGHPDEKYYIKRLVGKAGDTLEVKEPVLYRNGKPIEGAEAFRLNAEKTGEYEGYLARGWLSHGEQETLPDGYFYAMGDNSDESLDSRGWGHQSQIYLTDSSGMHRSKQLIVNLEKKSGKPFNFVPEKDVVGKAVFIFYPFSSRWGPAH